MLLYLQIYFLGTPLVMMIVRQNADCYHKALGLFINEILWIEAYRNRGIWVTL